MENQTAPAPNSDAITIEQSGMRMTIAHRKGLGGSDEGLTFDITTGAPADEAKRILRYDCFYKNPHYHIGASGDDSVHKMKDEGVEDSLMVQQAGYNEIAAKIDQQAIADQLTRLEPEILAKY
jgi:hypothetical protein